MFIARSFPFRAKSTLSRRNLLESLKTAQVPTEISSTVLEYIREKDEELVEMRDNLSETREKLVETMEKLTETREALFSAKADLDKTKWNGMTFQEMFRYAHTRSFQEHWEAELVSILWPGLQRRNVSRTRLYEAIEKGSEFHWPKRFQPNHPNPAEAMKIAQKTAQDLKEQFYACGVPDFSPIALETYAKSSKAIHDTFTEYFSRFGIWLKIPDQLLKDSGPKVECYYEKAMEFAKVHNFKVYSNPFAIQMRALQIIHDAIVEGEDVEREKCQRYKDYDYQKHDVFHDEEEQEEEQEEEIKEEIKEEETVLVRTGGTQIRQQAIVKDKL